MVKRLAPCLAIALAACTQAPAREVGREFPTIVSLNPCTDAILAEVADPQQILALSAYSSDPASSSMEVAKARQFPAVAGTVEEVAALRPDLVVGGTFMAPATVTALGGMGFRLEQFGIAPTVGESEAQVRRLAALAGHPERGEALVAEIEAVLAANRAPAGPPVPAIVWQSGGIVPGSDTLISDLLARTGFTNAAAARGMKQADVLPLELMLIAPPRVIFTAGSRFSEEDRLLRHPALAHLTDTRREPLSPALLWCGGPTIVRAATRPGDVRRSL
ncbi:ABC transporter substrate-binding protein [Novosphingobium sp.]|uniref:ABC transporter substrate-binding protein n=1 Tax=Novosphingobium sp. TaxID=1874826 RepID=UPI0035ADEA07